MKLTTHEVGPMAEDIRGSRLKEPGLTGASPLEAYMRTNEALAPR